jgi:hemolysin D
MSGYREPLRITSPTLHATVLFSLGVFAALLTMSFIFKVEVVARGEGRVVPISRVQVVQPEFSGVITAIHVQDGSAVELGDVLVELDPTEALAEYSTLSAERDRLRIERARIEASKDILLQASTSPDFAAQASFNVTADLSQNPFVEEQRSLQKARLADVRAALDQIAARELASQRSEDVTQAGIVRIEASLAIQRERFKTAEQLRDQGTTSRMAFLDAQEALVELERERDVLLRELDQKQAARLALETERRQRLTSFHSAALERKAEIDARLATLAEEIRASERRVTGAVLRAPVSGIVDQLSVYTIGGVAQASEDLMRIVPTDVAVEVVGTFSNQDIGFLEVGQTVNIGLEAYPSERFGFAVGQVSDIAADSVEIADGRWGYTIRVEPQEMSLSVGDRMFEMRPGMTATLDVTTDERRLISYFFAPIVATVQDALGER